MANMTEKEAKEFLQKYMTIAGSTEKIEESDVDFLKKYNTIISGIDAITVLGGTSKQEPEQKPEQETTPPTNPEDSVENEEDSNSNE